MSAKLITAIVELREKVAALENRIEELEKKPAKSTRTLSLKDKRDDG